MGQNIETKDVELESTISIFDDLARKPGIRLRENAKAIEVKVSKNTISPYFHRNDFEKGERRAESVHNFVKQMIKKIQRAPQQLCNTVTYYIPGDNYVAVTNPSGKIIAQSSRGLGNILAAELPVGTHLSPHLLRLVSEYSGSISQKTFTLHYFKLKTRLEFSPEASDESHAAIFRRICTRHGLMSEYNRLLGIIAGTAGATRLKKKPKSARSFYYYTLLRLSTNHEELEEVKADEEFLKFLQALAEQSIQRLPLGAESRDRRSKIRCT